MPPRKWILSVRGLAPGDCLMVHGLARDLRAAYPDCQVDIRTNFSQQFGRHSLHLTRLDKDKTAKHVSLVQKLEWFRTGQIHFAAWPHKAFEQSTRLKVPLTKPHSDLHLSDEERANPKIRGRYWVIVPGCKADMTVKAYSQLRWQEIVDRLREHGLRFVQEGSVKRLSIHPPLDRVLNVVGTTSIRDLVVNIHHSDGVVSGESLPAHIAAALGKPCVVIAGGRVSPASFAYNELGNFGPCGPPAVPHRYLHTIGQLKCCQSYGCHKDRVIKLNDRMRNDKNLCLLPTQDGAGQPVAECMQRISALDVHDAVMSYYTDGTLAPPELSRTEAQDWYRTRGSAAHLP